MVETAKKVDEFTIEIEKEVKQTYDIRFLKNQKKAIDTDLTRYVAARQAEINEIDQLLGKMDKLGIKDKEPDVVDI